LPSLAFTQYLDPLLADAQELDAGHTRLRTGRRGRQWGLGALNRAVVVMSVSAWEAYVEEVLREALRSIRPANPPVGHWSALNAAALSQLGRFNNPNVENVKSLFADYLGIADITLEWYWAHCASQHACDLLTEAIRFRHQIAHGVNPRPTIHNTYSNWLPGFFRRLAASTDRGIHQHLTTQLGAQPPW
jgi:hypothetical protein